MSEHLLLLHVMVIVCLKHCPLPQRHTINKAINKSIDVLVSCMVQYQMLVSFPNGSDSKESQANSLLTQV